MFAYGGNAQQNRPTKLPNESEQLNDKKLMWHTFKILLIEVYFCFICVLLYFTVELNVFVLKCINAVFSSLVQNWLMLL